MSQTIMVGCDLHDKTLVLKIAQGKEASVKRVYPNTPAGRQAMSGWLREQAERAGGAKLVFAYEASGQGFGLYDELKAAGFNCHVLAPSRISRSPAQKKQKMDDKDAEHLLDLLRAHVLAGNALPKVWIPDAKTRDDRELLRARCDVSYKISEVKSQIKGLLKRNRMERPATVGKGWTKSYWAWLRGLASPDSTLGAGSREALASLLRQSDALEEEQEKLDDGLAKLSQSPRYQRAVYALLQIRGVGLLTAMTYLTEIGDLKRFKNRRQLAAFLGLAPSCYESGECNDRNGHIMRQGPSRVQRVLCQAVWSTVRGEGSEPDAYKRIVTRNPKRKKVAVVALMRRLAIRMWHVALSAMPEGPEDKQAESEQAAATAAPGGRDHRAPSSLPPAPFPSSLLFRRSRVDASSKQP